MCYAAANLGQQIGGLKNPEYYNPYKNYTWETLIDQSTGKIRSDAKAAWNENWLDEISDNSAIRTEHIVSVNGGSERVARPEFKGRVLLSDDLRDTFGVGLKACGYSINSTNPDEIKAAYEWLKALKPSVRVFDVTATKQAFISEEVVAGLAWNGDAFIAMQENPDLEFIVPEEGMLIWLDNFAIPAGAEHKENAYKFISYLMRPEVAKLCVEEFNYSTPNKAAEKILEPEYAESKVIVLDPEELAKGEVTVNVGKARELYEKYWEQLKAGD